MPSPIDDRPGLLIRDSYGFSDVTLIIPPPVVPCLTCFDGEQTELDLRSRLVEITGQLEVGEFQAHLIQSLSSAGFLVDDVYEQLRAARQREFAEASVRQPAHAGSAYPDDRTEVRGVLNEYLSGAKPYEAADVIGIAAPHVSPFGGWKTYRNAFGLLSERYRDRTFIVLGTSHYGEPNRFGITRKPFVTPYGQSRADLSIIDELAEEPAAVVEDYCHAVEHSIEFRVLFLQHLFGADINVVPVLCGSYAMSIAGEESRRTTTRSSDFWASSERFTRGERIYSGCSASTWLTWARVMAIRLKREQTPERWKRLPHAIVCESTGSTMETRRDSGHSCRKIATTSSGAARRLSTRL